MPRLDRRAGDVLIWFLLLTAPYWLPVAGSYIELGTHIVVYALAALALNFLLGYTGVLSFGHAAYFGLGAYTSTIMQIDFGISPWIGMVAGGVVAAIASLPVGWLCFRLRGPYFTIATIATAQALMLIFLKFRDFAWGAEGTTIPNLGNAPLMMQFEAKAAYYYVALGLLAIGLAITYRIERSWMGYYLLAIGEDEGHAFIAMKLLSGPSLAELGRPLDARHVQRAPCGRPGGSRTPRWSAAAPAG